jgi:hypothetical protein
MERWVLVAFLLRCTARSQKKSEETRGGAGLAGKQRGDVVAATSILWTLHK